MNEDELANQISKLLAGQVQCILATLNQDGQPRQHVMAYVYSIDLTRIYLTTYKETQKFRNMLSNPSVSLMWDNRTGSTQDHLDGYSLTANGCAMLLSGTDQHQA